MPTAAPRIDQLERNLIINGNFDLFQRGVGPTTPGSSVTYLADRFGCAQSGYTMTQQRSTDVPTLASSLFQSTYCLLLTNGTGTSPTSGQYQIISYTVEGYDYANIHGKTVRIQFRVKSSVAGTYVFALRNASTTRAYVTTYTVTTPGVFQIVPLDIPLDSLGTWAFDNTAGLNLLWTLTSGTNFQTSTLNAWQTTSGTTWGTSGQTQWGATTGATFQVDQVMIIPQDFTQAGASNVIVPFQRAGRTFAHELAMAQRYYETSYDLGIAPGTVNSNGRYLTTGVGSAQRPTCAIPFKTTKRATPTVVTYSPGTGASGMYRNENASLDAASLLQQIGLGAFSFQPNDTPTAGHAVSVHWAADAEL